MSRADWTFLEHLLEEGQEYSTGIGRVWLTVLFLFRMLVLGTAVESAWDDEQRDFICNTLQPGCTEVCYDRAFPISHFRYFVLQVIFVSTPTIFYFGYVAIRSRKEEEAKEDGKQVEKGQTKGMAERDAKNMPEDKEKLSKGSVAKRSQPNTPKLKGRLLCAYAFSILLKVLLEVGFILGLWFLYNGFQIESKFECVGFPCPHTVDCFVSRPTEKTIFTIYTQAIAAVSLLLNLIELHHLLHLAISHRLKKRYRSQARVYRLQPERTAEASPDVPAPREETAELYDGGLPLPNEATAISVDCGPANAGHDVLPSYTNCMEAMHTSRPPRNHYTQKTKNNLRGVPKQKHYV
ncbi:gap junction alpha-4 protein [Syngnathus typhle]